MNFLASSIVAYWHLISLRRYKILAGIEDLARGGGGALTENSASSAASACPDGRSETHRAEARSRDRARCRERSLERERGNTSAPVREYFISTVRADPHASARLHSQFGCSLHGFGTASADVRMGSPGSNADADASSSPMPPTSSSSASTSATSNAIGGNPVNTVWKRVQRHSESSATNGTHRRGGCGNDLRHGSSDPEHEESSAVLVNNAD